MELKQQYMTLNKTVTIISFIIRITCNLSTIMKNNFTVLGLIFGAGIGICVGVLTNNLAICLSIGTGAGLALGTAYGAYVKEKKKACETKEPNH